MNYNTILWINLMVNLVFIKDLICAQNEPKFCDTNSFESIYNYGIDLKIKHKISEQLRWLWTYDKIGMTFTDPPQQETSDETVMTSFYVSSVPNCDPNDKNCMSVTKAFDMYFIRYYSALKGSEYTVVKKVAPKDPAVPVSDNEYPWGLNGATIEDIWPKDWSQDRNKPRSSAYWPQKNEVYYLQHVGHRHLSELVWSNITDPLWYQKLNTKRLDSDVRFTGMFYDRSNIYAIGTKPMASDFESKVYIVKVLGTDRQLVPLNQTVGQFFRCKQFIPLTTTTTTPIVTSNLMTVSTPNKSLIDDTKPLIDDNVKPKDNGFRLIIIIVTIVSFAVFLIVLMIIIAVIHIKTKGKVETVKTDMSSDMDSKKVYSLDSQVSHKVTVPPSSSSDSRQSIT